MKEIVVVFEVAVSFAVPDDFCDLVRQEQKEMGQQYLPLNPTDSDIYERVAWVNGIAKLSCDESMTEKLENMVTKLDTEEEFQYYKELR